MFVRIEQFPFRPGSEGKGLALLRTHLEFVTKSPGCARAFLAAPIHGPAHLVYSEWRSEGDIERMEAALRSPMTSGSFFGLIGLTSSPPHVARFEILP